MVRENNYQIPGGAEDHPPFPTYIPLEEGIPRLASTESSREYVASLLDVYVRDTPFKQTEIINLHEDLLAVAPKEISYKSTTISRVLWTMRKEGRIEQMDVGAKQQKDRVYVWKPAVPEFESILPDKPVPTLQKKRVRSPLKDPISEFFADLFHYVFR